MSRLYYNGDIITMCSKDDKPSAIVTQNDEIVYVGDYETARNTYKEAEMVNLDGKTIMPGFIDPHSHFFQTAQSINMCDLSEASSFADIVDINMGCPAPKVVKNGDGSKLLLDLELVKNIVEVAVENSKVPVTVKMRTGWDLDHIVAVEAAKIIEKAGASAITVHGRTRSQYYSGEADWDIIKKVKENVKIPVIGNGDLRSEEDIKNALEFSKVDAVMIGRASIGNPWIFKQTVEYLNTGRKLPRPSKQEKLETILKHIDLEIEEKGENIAIKEMRKHT